MKPLFQPLLISRLLCLFGLAFSIVRPVSAGQVLLNFENVFSPIGSQYSDWGVTTDGTDGIFVQDSTVSNLPSPTQYFAKLSAGGTSLTVNVSGGFTGISLYYSYGSNTAATVKVYSGPDATGTVLATMNMTRNAITSYNVWNQISATHAAALSFQITAVMDSLAIDDVRLTGAFKPRLASSYPYLTTLGGSTVTVNADVNPAGDTTSVTFQYATNSSFTGAQTTTAQNMGSGTTNVTATQTISGLARGTTYYIRALATNSAGTTTGNYDWWTTLQTVVTTSSTSSVTATSATLNGSVTPNDLATTAYFQYATNAAFTGASTTSTQSVGSGQSAIAVTAPLTGLSPGVYYFRMVATNSAGTFNGATSSFAINPGYTVNGSASGTFTDISGTGTQVITADIDDGVSAAVGIGFTFPMFGTNYSSLYLNSNGLVTFASSTSTYSNVDFGVTTLSPNVDAIATFWDDWVTTVGVYTQTTGSPGQRIFTAQWNVKAISSPGANTAVFQLQLFEASSDILIICQDVTTDASSGSSGASNGASASIGIRKAGAPSNGRFLMYSYNSATVTSGTKIRFSPLKPVIANLTATGLLNSATLRADINPNSSTTTARFEYGATTSYGNTASINLSPADGGSDQSISHVIAGLSVNTLYHYRVVATNELGTTTSADSTVYVGAGTLDPAFSSDGIQTTLVGAGEDVAYDVAVQPDGKIVAAGESNNGTNADFAIVRYNADGSLDTSFDTDGKTTTAIGTGTDIANAVAIQPDGKIIAAGYSSNGTNNDFALVRYNADGSPDSTFGTSGKVTLGFNLGGSNHDSIASMVLQPDGKIVCAGYANTASGFHNVAIARFHGLASTGTPGQPDASFGTGGKMTFAVGSNWSYALCTSLQADGKIVVGGTAGSGTAFDFILARVHGLAATGTPGTLDITFGSAGKVTTSVGSNVDEAHGIVIQPDGKIVLGGLSKNASNNNDVALARYTSTGVLDTTFGTGGLVTTGVQVDDYGFSVALQTDGRIVVGGSSNNPTADILAIRYNADGSLDTTFDADGKLLVTINPSADDVAYGMALHPDGNIVLAGRTVAAGGLNDFAVVRLLGLPKPGVWNLNAAQGTSGSNLGITGQVNPANLSTTVSLEYGTSNALGSTQSIGTFTGNALQNFNTTLYPDGLTIGTTYYYRIVATNDNGTTTSATQTLVYAPGGLDFNFASGGVQTHLGIGASQGRAVAIQSDGKIVVAGFTNNGTKNVPALVRYLSTGALDTTFGTGGLATMPLDGTNEQLYAVAIQSDGKIVAAGAAIRGGDWDMVLTRWTSTGQPDTSFEGDGVAFTGYGANQDLWQAVSILPSGQILVAGYTQSSTTADYVLARYNSDGTLDATFDGDSGTSNGRVVTSIGVVDGAAAMAVQPDGKIILAGDCDSSIGLIRFTSAGLIDTSFGTNGKIIVSVGVSTAIARSLALQPDGKIVAACTYFSAADDSNGLLMRFNANGTNDNTFDGDGRRGYGTSLNDSFHSVTIQPDGRIMAVGRSGNSAAVWGDMMILRANADGSQDTTFDGDGMLTVAPGPVNDHLYGVTQDASGNIIAAGLSDTSSGLAQFAVVRVLALPETTLIKNPSFESVENFGGGIVTGFNDWGWDVASSVTAENGITPYAGSRMLKFISSGPTTTPTSPWCDVPQYVDLSAYAPQISLGLVSATATARFNRVAGTASTDTRFDVIIEAHRGTVPGPFIVQNDVQLFSDANPSTWEPITNTYTLPTNTTHLLVGVYAYENIVDNSSGTEFDGHYADDVQLTINVAPFAPTFTSASSIGVTTAAPVLTGQTIGTITLGYAPTPGDSLMLIKNTGLSFITGQFSNLAQGQTVTLSYGGLSYNFVANYYGGTGNDLVLVWKDTKVWAWGYNAQGQVGNGSRSNLLVPTATYSGGALSGKTVIALSSGGDHSLALCSDGTLAAWGNNSSGQLGNNSTTDSNLPVLVNTSGVLSGKTVIAVDAGSWHSVALCSDGTLAAWGLNDNGQLGNGSTTSSSVPVQVNGGVLSGKTVVAISTTGGHSMALCSDGTLAAWGYNFYGQIGNGTTDTVSPYGKTVPTATTLSGALSGKSIIAIEAGIYHSLTLCSDGTVATWGYNLDGELGNNSTTNSSVPVLIATNGALSGKTVVSLSSRGLHNLALCSDGTLVSWGNNSDGRLGNNSTVNSSSPVLVNTSGVLSGKTVSSIAGGGGHSLALCTDGTLAAWGYNTSGNLGNNSTAHSSVPALVSTSPLATGQRFVQASGGHNTLALVASPPVPVVNTLAATGISGTSATLNSIVNPAGGAATVTFQVLGVTTGYSTTLNSGAAGSTFTNVSTGVFGLLPGNTYRYRVIVSTAGGVAIGDYVNFDTRSNNANLSALTLSTGTLSPSFDSGILSYTATVANSESSITLTPTVQQAGASLTVNGAANALVSLSIGSNSIPIVVTAQDGTTTKAYTVNVTRNTLPTLTLPASPFIAEATSAAGAAVTFSVTASDAEDGALTPSVNPASGSAFAIGDTTVNVSVTDAFGESTTGSFVVRVLSFQEVWRQTYLGTTANTGNAADSADFDSDGVPNLAEFAFGTLPNNGASGPTTIEVTNGVITRHGSPTVDIVKSPTSFSYHALFGRRKDWAANGLTFTVQFSGDLTTWYDSSATPTVIATDADIEAVMVPYPFFVGGKKAKFFRVIVGTQP